ncbi:MAG: ribonuclease P protein component [Mailhella sp.]|nr:ribonuclease P protein component [Mailhella sp.]
MACVRYTWQKDARLRKKSEYSACYEEGEKLFSRHFVLYRKKTGENRRVGFAVSKKCGNAAERNRIKRVLREFFRLYPDVAAGSDLVVIPKRHVKAEFVTLEKVEKDLLAFFARCGDHALPAASGRNACDAGTAEGMN